MDPPGPRDNRALLVEALRARVADPDRHRTQASPPYDPDTDTLDAVTTRAAGYLDEATDIVCRRDRQHPRRRGAIAYLERLEHGACMPALCAALCDLSDERAALADWLETLRRLYAAFWHGVATTPSAVPLSGRALGHPPTPRSVNSWLRAHFGEAAVMWNEPTQPLEHPAEWAALAGDIIESLWRHAAERVHRVPDIWPARRMMLWEHGTCAPETLFLLAVSDDIFAPHHHGDRNDAQQAPMGADDNDDVGQDDPAGTVSDGARRDGHAQRTRHADRNGVNNVHEHGHDRPVGGGRAVYNSLPGGILTRTAVLYAAVPSEETNISQDRMLRVACHASSVVEIDRNGIPQGDPVVHVFRSSDARTLLAPLGLPSAIPWTTDEAACRWLAAIVSHGPASRLARALLTPRAGPPPDVARKQAKEAGDAVRDCLSHVNSRRVHPAHSRPHPVIAPPIRTAERVDDAVTRALHAMARAVTAQGRSLVRPVQAVALDACLLDALLIDFWHLRPVRSPSYAGVATLAA